jgi:hypothetical protein
VGLCVDGNQIFLISSIHLLFRSLTLTKEAKCTAATLLFMRKITCCYCCEVHKMNKHHYENRKSFRFKTYLAHYSTMYHRSSSKRHSQSTLQDVPNVAARLFTKAAALCWKWERCTFQYPGIGPCVAVPSESSNFALCPRQHPLVPRYSLPLPLRVIPYTPQVHRGFSHAM